LNQHIQSLIKILYPISIILNNVTAYLVDTDQNLATNEAKVDKLNAVVEFASAATITSSTTNIDVSFYVGEGMQISSGSLDGAIFFK